MGTADKKQPKKTKRARLGRGLSSLVDPAPLKVEAPNSPVSEQNTDNTGQSVPQGPVEDGARVLELPTDEVRANPNQPRRVFDEEALGVLAESIRTHGLMQPIVVRKADEGYELIAGERRWRATKLAGLNTIRAVLDEADDERSAELALIENIQRADLNPIERAMGLRQLMDRYGSTQQQVAERMGMSRPALANLVRLLDLEPDLQEMVACGSLSTGHAKVLLSVDDPAQRRTLAQKAADLNWTVRLLEAECQQLLRQPAESTTSEETQDQHPDRVSSVLRDLERSLSEHFGTNVMLKTNRQGTKGRVMIEFYDLDQFDGLLSKLGIQGGAV
ncbi:MAG: ParB/RepB/Spo0J family partition protein [Phycisphaerales bacterium]